MPFLAGRPSARQTLTGRGARLPLTIVDDVGPAANLAAVWLGLGIDGLAAGAALEIRLNGMSLAWEAGAENAAGWAATAYDSSQPSNTWNNYPSELADSSMELGTVREWALLLPAGGVIGLVTGPNLLEVGLSGGGRGGDGGGAPAAVLREVRLTIEYGAAPPPPQQARL
eukprot:SAG22_NODE_1532_length_4207_cov_2.263632_6_plen_170_part_00